MLIFAARSKGWKVSAAGTWHCMSEQTNGGDDQTPEPEAVGPDREPDQIRPSATGLVVPDETEHRTGEQQAKDNAENDPPA
jgi:hypothetical protein